MSLKRVVSGKTNITPMLNLSECFNSALNEAYSKVAPKLPAAIASTSKYGTGAKGRGCMGSLIANKVVDEWVDILLEGEVG